jgi:hypothetical protein
MAALFSGLATALIAGAAILPQAAMSMVGVPVSCPAQTHFTDSEVPRLTGQYLAARDHLRKLGFVPLRLRDQAHVCVTKSCQETRTLPEAECATDVPECAAYWRAPNGRILKIETCGDERSGRIAYIGWATAREVSTL